MNNKRAIIIDGNSLVYRMFYASYKQLDYFKQHNLFPTNAINLTISSCWKLLNKNKYDYALVAFDSDKKTFRNELLDDYKGKRIKMPEELYLQLPIIREFLEAIGFNTLNIQNIEADDIIGSLSKELSKRNITSDLYSSDKDLLQLVDKNISVNLIKKGLTDIQNNNINNFHENNEGLDPLQIIDFKALVGDSSDNLKGIKGIGTTTGIKLIKEYKTLNNLYENIDNLQPTIKQKLFDHKDYAYLCYELATIKTDLFNNNFNEDDFMVRKMNNEKIKFLIQEYKLKSLERYF